MNPPVIIDKTFSDKDFSDLKNYIISKNIKSLNYDKTFGRYSSNDPKFDEYAKILLPVARKIFNSSTLNYMKIVNLRFPPEDVYFSKNLQDYKTGKVANWDTAYQFSSESSFNPNSFGCHQLWVCTTKWQNHLKRIFKYEIYKF